MYIELLTVNDKMTRSFVCSENMENGAFVTVDGLAALTRFGVSLDGEAYKVKKLVDEKGELFGIVAPDNHRHDERLLSGDVPTIVAGKVERGYFLSKGDVIRVEVENIDGDVVVGDKVAPKGGTFKLTKATIAGGAGDSKNILGKIVKKEKYQGRDTVIILFV